MEEQWKKYYFKRPFRDCLIALSSFFIVILPVFSKNKSHKTISD